MSAKYKTYNILHVEDEQLFIDMVKIMLNDKLFNVDVAYDGSEAVSLNYLNEYDLILMDIFLPVMDGIEASKTIKKMTPNIPILVLTASDVSNLYGMNFFDGILRKPITKDELRMKIIDVIENKK
jgi:CheY-like chemotaxis protein